VTITDKTRKEIHCQLEAMKQLHPSTARVELWIADHFAPAWRDIINSFEEHLDRVPTSAELLWVLGERLRGDPREMVRVAETEEAT
jgi:hypothetical protein